MTWANWTELCTSYADFLVARDKRSSTVSVQRCRTLLLLRWTLTDVIHRGIPGATHKINLGTGYTTIVIDINQTLAQIHWTLAPCRFLLETNVVAEICVSKAVVRIIAPHNVISAPHVLFEETRTPDETINITYIVSMSTMSTAVRMNRTQVFTNESRSM